MHLPSAHLLILPVLGHLATGAAENVATYNNPLWGGFHPDPSCIFVAERNNTIFCVTSTFNVFPGLPVYASRDVVTWNHVSNGLSRKEQLPLLDYLTQGPLSGIYAPTIRYKDGIFYLLSTLVDRAIGYSNPSRWHNFVMTSRDPFDPDGWSDPLFFDYPGMDPDLFWDEDGTPQVAGGVGGRRILQLPLDLKTGEVFPPFVEAWNGTGYGGSEGPHYFEKDGWIYLLIAEGGPRERHHATMARARSLKGPWEEHPGNPMLTAYKNTTSYFQALGHADMFQDSLGQWWAVAIGSRAGGRYTEAPQSAIFPMGRETVLTPVQWDKGEWPVFQHVNGTMTGNFKLPPKLPLSVGRRVNSNDMINFRRGKALPLHLLHWRLPKDEHYIVSPPGHDGSIELRSSRLNLTAFDADASRGWGQTFLGRKQEHTRFLFSVDIQYDGLLKREEQEVGISALQDEKQHFDLGVVALSTQGGSVKPHIRFRGLNIRDANHTTQVEEVFPIPSHWGKSKVRFQVEALNVTHYEFRAGAARENDADVDFDVFGYCTADLLYPYYIGAIVGVYATTNGRYADAEFSAYVSRWRYNGLEQVISEPKSS